MLKTAWRKARDYGLKYRFRLVRNQPMGPLYKIIFNQRKTSNHASNKTRILIRPAVILNFNSKKDQNSIKARIFYLSKKIRTASLLRSFTASHFTSMIAFEGNKTKVSLDASKVLVASR